MFNESFVDCSNLEKANLQRAYFSNVLSDSTNYKDVDFRGAKLIEAELPLANFQGVDFSKAQLSKSNLSGAILKNTNFSGADLTEANLSFAHLTDKTILPADILGYLRIQEIVVEEDTLTERSSKDFIKSISTGDPTRLNNITPKPETEYSPLPHSPAHRAQTKTTDTPPDASAH